MRHDSVFPWEILLHLVNSDALCHSEVICQTVMFPSKLTFLFCIYRKGVNEVVTIQSAMPRGRSRHSQESIPTHSQKGKTLERPIVLILRLKSPNKIGSTILDISLTLNSILVSSVQKVTDS